MAKSEKKKKKPKWRKMKKRKRNERKGKIEQAFSSQPGDGDRVAHY